jgi:hypothetical protein
VNKDNLIPLSEQAIKDLGVWMNFLFDPEKWNPIPPRPCNPPLAYKLFVSDAAGSDEGAADMLDKGVGCVGRDEEGSIILVHQILWPDGFLYKKDGKGVRFGDKSSTLEVVGLLIPFLLMTEKFKNQNVVLKLDNTGIVYGWENNSLKNDICASIFVRALKLIGIYLSCKIHVQHVKRMTTWEARLANQLSRTSTTGRGLRKRSGNYSSLRLPKYLYKWFENPVQDWDLCMKLLYHVIKKC